MATSLHGRVILVVEDEILVAMDIQTTLESRGAQTLIAYSVAQALVAVEAQISAAVVDHALGDGDSSEICKRLTERNVPFICSSAHSHIAGPCAGAKNLGKPCKADDLIAALDEVLT